MQEETKASVVEETVTLGDKTVETSAFDRYKGVAGQSDRLAILSGSLLRAYVHFFNDKGTKVIRCFSTQEKKGLCCEKMGMSQQRFGLILYKYVTNDKGELAAPEKCQGKILLWAISENRYEELSNVHRNWPLLDGGETAKQHDLLVTCTETNFQRMNFTPLPEAHWKRKAEWYKILKAKAERASEKLRLVLGRKLNQSEIDELFGLKKSAPTAAPAGEVNLDDILDG